MTPLRMNGGGTENVWEDGSRRREGGDERGENQIRGRAWQEGGKYRTGGKHIHACEGMGCRKRRETDYG